uniref:Uncharacterized protein n=1 Tax=Arundo donax TaxID=35708 RepID=A0A0A9GN51_ARUDO
MLVSLIMLLLIIKIINMLNETIFLTVGRESIRTIS